MLDYTNIINQQGTLETIYKEGKAKEKLRKGREARIRQLERLRIKNIKIHPEETAP